MQWMWTHIEAISACFGAVSAAWAFLVKADRSIKKHLAEEFATKADLEKGLNRIEKKVDKIMSVAFHIKDNNTENKIKLL